MEDGQRGRDVRSLRPALGGQAHALRGATRGDRGAGVLGGLRRAPEALQCCREWEQDPHGVEADYQPNQLASFKVGLAAEEERECEAVVTG